MKATPNPSLRSLNTFGLDASAASLVEIESEEDILALPGFDPAFDLVLGGGSNVVFLSDVPGTVYLNRIPGMAAVEQDGDDVFVEAGAGEDWHRLVLWSLEQGLSGLENLSLIPGSVGAAPIQNIGAYGVELASVLESVTAWDWKTSTWVTLGNTDCLFAYRDSRFKSAEPDRYLVTSIRLRLSRRFEPKVEYEGLRAEIGTAGLSPRSVGDAVIRLRERKLPNLAVSGNAGSFFKNPVIGADQAEELLREHAYLPAWPQPEARVKLSAAWMIEACGLKGLSEGGAQVSERHALVLVNRGGASGHDISTLAVEIQKAVYDRFGVRLEPEPRLVDFTPG
jgi:UDP-N-acetylmuramate dehydrogenase